MEKRYQLLIQNNEDLLHRGTSLAVLLVDTQTNLAIIDAVTTKEYQSDIEEMVSLMYKDNVRIIKPKDLPSN